MENRSCSKIPDPPARVSRSDLELLMIQGAMLRTAARHCREIGDRRGAAWYLNAAGYLRRRLTDRDRVRCPGCDGQGGALFHRMWLDCDRCQGTGKISP